MPVVFFCHFELDTGGSRGKASHLVVQDPLKNPEDRANAHSYLIRFCLAVPVRGSPPAAACHGAQPPAQQSSSNSWVLSVLWMPKNETDVTPPQIIDFTEYSMLHAKITEIADCGEELPAQEWGGGGGLPAGGTADTTMVVWCARARARV
eukprot:gene24237-biopygen8925